MNKEYDKIILDFLNEKFIFKEIEIISHLNKAKAYFYSQPHITSNDQILDFQNLENIEDSLNLLFRDYRHLSNKSIKYISSEFLWFLSKDYKLLMKLKNKKKIIRERISFLIENNLKESLNCNSEILKSLNKQRIRVKNVKPLPYNKREKIDLNVGDHCYICINKKVVNSAIITQVWESMGDKDYRVIQIK